MYTIRRFAPHLYAALVFGAFIWMFFQPESIFGLFVIKTFSATEMIGLFVFLAVILLLAIIFIGSGRNWSSRARFSYFPFIFLSSSYFLFLLTDYQPFLVALIIITPLFLWFWLENLYLFWQRTALYQAYTLERLATYFYVVTVFILVYALTGAQVLVQIPFWSIMMLFAISFGGLLFDSFLLHKHDPMESLVVAVLGVLLGSQLFFILQLLPAHFSFSSSIMCLFYYLYSGLGRILLGREKSKKLQATYITVSSVGFISILVSSLLISV